MSIIRQIEDKGAVTAWSPLKARPNLLALATKEGGGGGFDEYGGELSIVQVDQSSSSHGLNCPQLVR